MSSASWTGDHGGLRFKSQLTFLEPYSNSDYESSDAGSDNDGHQQPTGDLELFSVFVRLPIYCVLLKGGEGGGGGYKKSEKK